MAFIFPFHIWEDHQPDHSPFSEPSLSISPWTKEPLFSSLATALLKHLEAKQLGVRELRHAASAFGQCRGGRTVETAGAGWENPGKIRGKFAFFGGKFERK
jgi:hypothetical protein